MIDDVNINQIPVVTPEYLAQLAYRSSQEVLLAYQATQVANQPAAECDSQSKQVCQMGEASQTDATDQSEQQIDSHAHDFARLLPDCPPVFLDMLDEQRFVLQRHFNQQFYSQLLGSKDASGHLLVRLNESLDMTPIVRVCQDYRANNGLGTEATHTIEHYCRGLILRHLYDLSFRQLEHAVRYNWLYRWFVGYPLYGPTFDHTTLADFSPPFWAPSGAGMGRDQPCRPLFR